MKKVFKIALGVLFVAILIGTFVFLWTKTRPKEVVFEIVEPKIDTVRQYVVATGRVEPRDEVLIKPQISGIISSVLLEAGDKVRKGDVIATVKVIPEIGQLNGAESRVALARISLQQVESESARTATLFEKGVVAKEDYDKSVTLLKQAKEEMLSAQDNLEIVQNGISKRYAAMSNTQIRSTIDGMILDIPIKEGNSVILSNTFNDGTTIATIADMSNMLFKGKVDETDVGKLSSGMDVKLTIGALQNVELKAHLEYVSPKSVDVNGVIMFEVKAAVTIPDSVFIRAGYSANASILISSREGIIMIPEMTLSFKDGKSFVNLLTSADEVMPQVFEEREVKTGMSDGLNIEVTEGVAIGDKLRGNQKQL